MVYSIYSWIEFRFFIITKQKHVNVIARSGMIFIYLFQAFEFTSTFFS